MTLPLTHINPEPLEDFVVLSAEAQERRTAEAEAAREPGFTLAQARVFALKFYLFLLAAIAVPALWRILK